MFRVYLVLAFVLTACACVAAANTSGESAIALGIFQPLINALSSFGMRFVSHGHPTFAYGALGVVIIIAALSYGRGSLGSVFFSLAVCCAVAAQIMLVDQALVTSVQSALGDSLSWGSSCPAAVIIGVFFYTLALIFFWLGARGRSSSLVTADSSNQKLVFGWLDLVAATAIFLIALVLRIYATNQMPSNFEGELSPYSAGATSLHGMFFANKGVNGPWAPLGILYYMPIYLTTELFGINLVALRLSSAIVGLFTLPLIFLFAYRVSGRVGAHVASALFALNFLHIGWSRTDVHPHGVTTWPTVLLCIALLKAGETRSAWWGALVALAMGLTWHQYPSGQSAVVIPFVAIGLYWFFNKSMRFLSIRQLALVALGAVLWFVGLPLSYYVADGEWHFQNPFNLTGPRASWGGSGVDRSSWEILSHVVTQTLGHLADFLQGLFYKVPYLFHQEWLHNQEGFFVRSVGWLEMSFVVIGVFLLLASRKRFESCVLLAWIIAAILPGILSERAYPKRLSTVFPALDIVAAVGVAQLVRYCVAGGGFTRRLVSGVAIIAAFGAQLSFTAAAWFSGHWVTYGVPKENQIASTIASQITPSTIVITDLCSTYDSGKYLYLLLDHLTNPKNRPNMFYQTCDEGVEALISDPLKTRDLVARNLPYVWTKLRDQVGETSAYTDWRTVLFIVHDLRESPNRDNNRALIDRITASCETPQLEIVPGVHEFTPAFLLISCSVEALKRSNP